MAEAQREDSDWLKKVFHLKVQGRRPAQRPSKTWKDVVVEDLRALHLRETDALNRDIWRSAIKGDPSNPAVPGKRT